MILEKEVSIGEDPRGVYLAGDAIRVLYQLGIGDQIDIIGERKEDPPMNYPGINSWLQG